MTPDENANFKLLMTLINDHNQRLKKVEDNINYLKFHKTEHDQDIEKLYDHAKSAYESAIELKKEFRHEHDLARKFVLEEVVPKLAQQNSSPTSVRKIPHKCPVCQGKGHYLDNYTAPIDPYENVFRDASGNKYYTCKTCDGTGIIWGK